MSTIILDDCLLYLYEAEKCLNEYKELDAYMEIFEAENPEVKEQVEKNEKAKSGAIENIKKAAKAVLDMIKKLIRTVGDFIEKRKLSVDERAAYEAFKEAAKKDPSLKNKKITVRNFKEIEAEYQKVLKELEEDGLIIREEYDVLPPKVEYYLTDIGYTLRPVIESMQKWGKEYKRLRKLMERYKN